MGFDTAVLLISAYANPVETMEHARRLGYRCTDFMVTPLPFGYYSSEPKVTTLGISCAQGPARLAQCVHRASCRCPTRF